MKIRDLTTRVFQIPLTQPWGDQTHSVNHIELVLVALTADNGRIGTGFSYTMGVGAQAIQALIDWDLAPRLRGAEVSPVVLWPQLWHELHDAGGGGISTLAIGAVDIAMWDLLAMSLGRPLVEMLGQRRPSIPAYGSGINLNWSEAAVATQVEGWRDRGYRGAKIKVGKQDIEEDMDRVASARHALGPTGWLMLDANQGWDLTEATARCRALERFHVRWLEEPLLSDDVGNHAKLASRSLIPLSVGENSTI